MPAYVQSAKNSGTGTSITVSFTSNTGAGNAIVVAGRIGATTPAPTCTDSQGNIYGKNLFGTISNVGNYNSVSQVQTDIFVTANAAAAADTVTYKSSVSGSIRVAIHEYSGLVKDNAGIVDPVGVASAIDPGGSGNTTPSSGIATPANSTCVLFGAVALNAGTATYTAGNMGTNVAATVRQSVSDHLITQDNIVYTSGPYQTNATLSTTDNWNALFVALATPVTGQAGYLSPISLQAQFFTNAGAVLAGGKIATYVAGTVTATPTYTDYTLTTANANPIILSSAGRLPASVWQPTGVPIKVVISDSSNNVLMTIDNVAGINDPASGGRQGAGVTGYARTVGEYAAGVIPSDYSFPPLTPERYGAVGDGVVGPGSGGVGIGTNNTAALNNWVAVVNATTNPVAQWPSGLTYLTLPLNTITASNLTWTGAATVLAAPNTQTGGVPLIWVTGANFTMSGLTVNGNQFAFAGVGNDGLYITNTTNPRLENVTITAMSGIGLLIDTVVNGSMTNCSVIGNAAFGGYFNNVSYFNRANCQWNQNGWGFQVNAQPMPGTISHGMGVTQRFRTHHMTITADTFNQNGIDGCNFNDGAYAIKCVGCLSWGNGDGGFTLAGDSIGDGRPGDNEPCYDIWFDSTCEAYNNWGGGCVLETSCYNVKIQGRYYNNGAGAGFAPPIQSIPNGIFIGNYSLGVVVDATCYDDRQLCPITGASVSGSNCVITATRWGTTYNWGAGGGTDELTPDFTPTASNYPRVALYSPGYVFEGYATIYNYTESAGSVTITAAFNGTASQPASSTTMTVTAVTAGSLAVGDYIAAAGGTIIAFISGTGGVGTYKMSTTTGFSSTVITANYSVILANIASNWFVTQRVQHNGMYIAQGAQVTVGAQWDHWGELPGYNATFGYGIYAYPSNGQNILFKGSTPRSPLIIVGGVPTNQELLLNPSWDVSANTGWTYSGTGSAAAYTTTGSSLYSGGAVQLTSTGGTPYQGVGALQTAFPSSNFTHNCFVEFSCLVTSAAPGAYITLNNAGVYSTTVAHPGGGTRELKIGMFAPAGSAFSPTIGVTANATAVFDEARFTVHFESYDNRGGLTGPQTAYGQFYPTRNLAV